MFFLLPFLLGLLMLFLIPLNKKFAYNFVKGECSNKASWIYNRIFENDESIDIAFSGASQTGCAIMDEFIEESIKQQTGADINVANLGYCRRGRDIQYTMLKDLFEHKNPKILVLEVPESEPKKSHPIFPYLANSNDLFGSVVFFNQRYFLSVFKGVAIRLEQLKALLFSTEANTYNYSNYSYTPKEQIVSIHSIKDNKLAWTKRLSKQKPELLQKIELNYSKHYLQKIAKLVNSNNCKLLFLYLPESGSQLRTPLLNGFYSEMAPVILLNDSTITNPNNWMDAMHFNDNGAREASELVVEFLLTHVNTIETIGIDTH